MTDDNSAPSAAAAFTPPRILIGVDGSEDSIRSVRYGVGRAKRRDEDLWLVNAVDDGVVAGGWGVIYDPSVLDEAGHEAVEQAKQFAIDEGVAAERIHTDVFVGHPAGVLGELSKKAEICIVGRRAASGLERMFVGSTSTSLAATVSCPLVVISQASTPDLTGKYGVVAVAVGSARTDKALRWGAAEAQSRDARLEILHIVPVQPRGILDVLAQRPDDLAAWEKRAGNALEAIVEPLRHDFPGVEITLTSKRGSPADELLAATARVDLLALNLRTHPATGIALTGPVRGILAHSQCPVALIR